MWKRMGIYFEIGEAALIEGPSYPKTITDFEGTLVPSIMCAPKNPKPLAAHVQASQGQRKKS